MTCMFSKTLPLCILGVSVGISIYIKYISIYLYISNLYNKVNLAEVSNVLVRNISSFTLVELHIQLNGKLCCEIFCWVLSHTMQRRDFDNATLDHEIDSNFYIYLHSNWFCFFFRYNQFGEVRHRIQLIPSACLERKVRSAWVDSSYHKGSWFSFS